MSAHSPSISGRARSAGARDLPNGRGAAALLAAGIGSLSLSVLAILADKIAAIKTLMNFYKPTGPLSGVTTCAIGAWLIMWAILHARWRERNLAIARVSTITFLLLFLGLLLTFPPLADMF